MLKTFGASLGFCQSSDRHAQWSVKRPEVLSYSRQISPGKTYIYKPTDEAKKLQLHMQIQSEMPIVRVELTDSHFGMRGSATKTLPILEVKHSKNIIQFSDICYIPEMPKAGIEPAYC